MAIHPNIPSEPSQPGHLTPQQAHAISSWTEQATISLQNLDITAPEPGVEGTATAIRSIPVSLAIPLDDPVPHVKIVKNRPEGESHGVPSTSYGRRGSIRRDSLKRREALLKGKEGSRRRQRWENDRLLNNPWAQPPSASDWLIQPTYPRHGTVPYYLAPLWDAHYAHKEHGRGSRATRSNKSEQDERYQIPKDLRKKFKHARAARGLLQDLEEDIRRFVQAWNQKQSILREEGLEDAPTHCDSGDSEDEIVFVGRNGQMHDSPERKKRLQQMKQAVTSHHENDGEKMVFGSLAHDRQAAFGRWLVHSIANYYGLYTWSMTVGNPARREAYVGFKPPSTRGREGQISLPPVSVMNHRDAVQPRPDEPLPKPLWIQL